MKHMNKRRALLETMIRLEERDLEILKAENRLARQALGRMERSVEAANSTIAESEGRIRAVLDRRLAISMDELQGQRCYLKLQRDELAEHLKRKEQAVVIAESIGEQLMGKQKKLNKLYELVDDVSKRMRQWNEQRVLKENDELWVRSQEYK